MFRRLRPLACALAVAALAVAAATPLAAASSGALRSSRTTTTSTPAPASAARAVAGTDDETTTSSEETTTTTTCASAVASGYTVPTEPSRGRPCWTEITPYPFGSYENSSGIEEAGPVEMENPRWRQEHPWCVRFGLARTVSGDISAPEGECYLTVTSMAFRSWNHGVAATFPESEFHDDDFGPAEKNPYGVWIFDDTPETGPEWYPDPTFPGRKACPGHTIVWAGKLDYWLVGGPSDTTWSRLCRFDGATGQWQLFSVPANTLRRLTPPVIGAAAAASSVSRAVTPAAAEKEVPNKPVRPGGITSAACLAWWDCWFFGTYGVVLHWNGSILYDVSPNAAERWLDGEYISAAENEYPLGNPFAVVVSGTAEHFSAVEHERELIPMRPGKSGVPPPELFASVGWEFEDALLGESSALPFSPPTEAQVDPTSGWQDPYRTDLVAVGFNEGGQGWVAGNPAGYRTNWACSFEEETCARPKLRELAGAEALAPLVPVSLFGVEQKCTEGEFAPEHLTYSDVVPPRSETGSFLWSSLAVVPAVGAIEESQLPASGEAFAGGLTRPHVVEGGERNSPGTRQEPVIVQASCDGRYTTTRFRAREAADQEHTEHFETTAADRAGTVTAIVASAKNDVWASTSDGLLEGREEPGYIGHRERVVQQPRLYQFTDGQPPMAPEGNEEEERPIELQENPPTYIFEPAPEPPLPPVPPPVTTTNTTHEPPAVYGVKAKLHQTGAKFSLYLTFKLRRPVTLGAQGLRSGRVVASARPRHFAGSRGTLVLELNRKHWPTKIRFTS